MTTKIIVNDPRYGGIFNTGINGRLLAIPMNQEYEADKEVRDHLDELGVAYIKAPSGAGSNVEGSGKEPAPTPKAAKKAAPKKAAPKKAVAKKGK